MMSLSEHFFEQTKQAPLPFTNWSAHSAHKTWPHETTIEIFEPFVKDLVHDGHEYVGSLPAAFSSPSTLNLTGTSFFIDTG